MTDVIIDLRQIVPTISGTKEFHPSLAQCRLVCRRYLSNEVIAQPPIVWKRIFQGVQRLRIFPLVATIMVWYELDDKLDFAENTAYGYLVLMPTRELFCYCQLTVSLTRFFLDRWKKEVWVSIVIRPYPNVVVVGDGCHRLREILRRWTLELLEPLSWLLNVHRIRRRLLI
jgi:hypothetical protein